MSGEDDLLRSLNEQFGHEVRSEDKALPPEEEEVRRNRKLHAKEVKVLGVFEHPKGTFVLLRDNGGRAMPIWIGQAEGLAISVALEGHATPRPLAHDLLKTLLDHFTASVDSVLVDDLHNATYYAKICLRHNSSESDIDCRPSDAIAVALRVRAPIYVAEHVLEEAKVEWEEG